MTAPAPTSAPTRRPSARTRVLAPAVALLLGGLVAGCSGGTDPAPGSNPPPAGRSSTAVVARTPVSAALATSGAPVVALSAGDPAELSVRISGAVFRSAPAVVVASADDQAGVQAGAEQASRLGVPLLLLPAGGEPLPAAFAAEVSRLAPRTVLAVGATGDRLGSLHGVEVVTDPTKLPAITPPAGGSPMTVLTRAASKKEIPSATVTALTTTVAAATGHQPVALTNRDPRADPKAIAALAQQKPQRVVAVGDFGSTKRLAARVAVAKTGVQLPGGGQLLLPGKRFVALYGHPDTSALGVLGEQGVKASVARAEKMAKRYDPLSKMPVVPTFEIIATTLQGSPGPDGDYSFDTPIKTLKPWVEQARKSGVYVVLDLQPGRADFLSQAKRYEELLKLPNVGLALDPEWRLSPNQRPLVQIGGVDAAEINRVSDWLAGLTAKNQLPQKLLVLHQFQLSMIRNEKKLDTRHDELQLLIHMDGQGSPDLKEGTWRAVVAAAPQGMPFGWKNFYDEDKPMLTPKQTMAKRPVPDMISYQ